MITVPIFLVSLGPHANCKFDDKGMSVDVDLGKKMKNAYTNYVAENGLQY